MFLSCWKYQISVGLKTVIYVDLKKENCRRTEAAVMTDLKLKQDASHWTFKLSDFTGICMYACAHTTWLYDYIKHNLLTWLTLTILACHNENRKKKSFKSPSSVLLASHCEEMANCANPLDWKAAEWRCWEGAVLCIFQLGGLWPSHLLFCTSYISWALYLNYTLVELCDFSFNETRDT